MNLDILPSDQHLQARWVAIDAASQKRPGFRLRRTSVIGLLVVGLVGGSGFAAFAAYESADVSTTGLDPVSAEQVKLFGALNDEQTAWSQRLYNVAVGPGTESEKGWPAGYGGTKIDMDTRVLSVYWVGTPPDDVADFLGEPTSEFSVELVTTTVSKHDLDHAALKIMSADQKHRLVEGIHVTYFSHTADRSGLVIKYVLDAKNLPENAEKRLLAAAREITDVRIARAEITEPAVFLPSLVEVPEDLLPAEDEGD